VNSTVKDVMSTRVIAVRQDAPYKEMAAMLHAQRVSAFPVLDEGNKVIGVVSEADLLTKEALEGTVPRTLLSRQERVRRQVNALTAADLMTKPPVTIGPDETVTHAARLMFDQRVKRLPVISDDGTLIGIVTRADLLSVYSRPDAEIRHQVTQGLILDTFLCDPDRFTVTVKDGIVTIGGTPETSAVGLDIVSAIRHMEGVVAVRDRLNYPQDSPYRPRVSSAGDNRRRPPPCAGVIPFTGPRPGSIPPPAGSASAPSSPPLPSRNAIGPRDLPTDEEAR
jgi:CBS-domain-containing membrane protein